LIDSFREEIDLKEVEIKWTRAIKWIDMDVMPGFDVEICRTAIKTYCDFIENTMTIRSNGDVVACCYDLTSRMVFGNIMEKNLIDIWNGEKRKMTLDSIKSGKPNQYCSQCNVINPHCFLIKGEYL
jgi:radical SAM protein with 4Fe4S-binding SPASM domain